MFMRFVMFFYTFSLNGIDIGMFRSQVQHTYSLYIYIAYGFFFFFFCHGFPLRLD